MKNPSLKAYVQGILAGIIISLIVVGIPIFFSLKKSCEITQADCSYAQVISALFSLSEFLLATIIFIAISVFVAEYYSRIMNAKKA